MANAVTLTFAGDDAQLSRTFDNVGGAAERMGARVGESATGFDRAAESSDVAESRAQGFSDTLTGTADVAAGTSAIMKGDLFEGFTTLGGGLADLAGGFTEFLIPAIARATAAFQASKVGQLASAAATKVAAASQWILNAAMSANPIGLVVIAVVALIAIIVLIATKTDWFQRAWKASWGWIKDAASSTWEFLKKIPGWIGDAFGKVADFIVRPYKWAFNKVAEAWNNTIGRLSWSVPDWIPGIGGNTISVPNLPYFHAGGRVPGAPGQNVMAMLQAGEEVSSAAGGGRTVLELRGSGRRIEDLLIEVLADGIRVRGGDVQRVLGARDA